MDLVFGLFLILGAAAVGGIFARSLKLPPLVGYILAGVVFGSLIPENIKNFTVLAQVGTILLLFSVGIELSFDRLAKFLSVAVFGALIQIVLVSGIGYFFLRFSGFNSITSVILASGFSLSSTAVVVKLLSDSGELDTIHGGVMFGWLLVQDLAVVPMMIILPLLSTGTGQTFSILISIGKAALVIVTSVLLGKIIFPKLIHIVAGANSRELLLLSSVCLALGTAFATSLLGISPMLGAFLAGFVISQSQENHAIFSETRPLRDLFVALFFVTLGFMVTPGLIVANFGLIVLMTVSIILIKIIVVFIVSSWFGFRGRTGIANSFGLAQIGEFSFVIFSTALSLHLINFSDTTLGISVTLFSLAVSPILFKLVVPIWRKLRDITLKMPNLNKFFLAGEARTYSSENLSGHIIICGYGRVGSWVGRVFEEYKIPFVVVDYNQKVVGDLKDRGTPVLYGDPTEPEVLEMVSVRNSKAIILAIPDRVAQETLITYVQTVAPDVKIVSRAHLDEDWDRLKTLRVDKIVQPEFEAAVEIIRSVLTTFGKPREEIRESVKRMRMSHSKK